MQRRREVQRGMRHQHREQDDQQQPAELGLDRDIGLARRAQRAPRHRDEAGQRQAARQQHRGVDHIATEPADARAITREQPPQQRRRRQPGCEDPGLRARLRQRTPEHHRDDDRVAVQPAVEIPERRLLARQQPLAGPNVEPQRRARRQQQEAHQEQGRRAARTVSVAGLDHTSGRLAVIEGLEPCRSSDVHSLWCGIPASCPATHSAGRKKSLTSVRPFFRRREH